MKTGPYGCGSAHIHSHSIFVSVVIVKNRHRFPESHSLSYIPHLSNETGKCKMYTFNFYVRVYTQPHEEFLFFQLPGIFLFSQYHIAIISMRISRSVDISPSMNRSSSPSVLIDSLLMPDTKRVFYGTSRDMLEVFSNKTVLF